MKYTKNALGSRLEITFFEVIENDSVVTESFSLIDDFEKKYSRFIEGNILSAMNTQKKYTLEPEIVALVRLCIKVSEMTQGSFDITLLPLLENTGYGIREEKMNESFGYKNIDLKENILTLHNEVQIEFGSCGKWYLLDLVYNTLRKYYTHFVLNFGWDIRVSGEQEIVLEDPLDTTKSIWKICLRDWALASSSGNRRKTDTGHHLIDMQRESSQNDKLAIYVTHPLWVMADIFATALFVSPLEKSLEILEKTNNLEALIISREWKIYKSQGFTVDLHI